jgi:chromosome segregation ATPase
VELAGTELGVELETLDSEAEGAEEMELGVEDTAGTESE